MNEQAYVLITPYSLYKSRTGGIIARLLSTADLEFCAIKMYTPSRAMVDEYIKAVEAGSLSSHNKELVYDYVNKNLRPDTGLEITNRCLVLFFEGQNALSVIKRLVGHVTYKPKGDTIRGTFGDYVVRNNEVVYFEPAVLCADDATGVKEQLKVFKKYADQDGGVIHRALEPILKKRNDYETTLVMLKPDMFHKRSSRPGNIIDFFSKTGLFVVGAKLIQFSVEKAEKFYAPIKEILVTKLERSLKEKLALLLKNGLPYSIGEEELNALARLLRERNAEYEFNRIISYITGQNPEQLTVEEKKFSGAERCLVLLYYGVNAVAKIRDKLGSTDPQTAKYGTVRSEFGQDILKNGVHASDSVENALKEREITGLIGNEMSELDSLIKY